MNYLVKVGDMIVNDVSIDSERIVLRKTWNGHGLSAEQVRFVTNEFPEALVLIMGEEVMTWEL